MALNLMTVALFFLIYITVRQDLTLHQIFALQKHQCLHFEYCKEQ